MTPPTKKLLGTIIIILWIPIYALLAMSIGVHVLPRASGFTAFFYYLLAGTLWIIPIGLLLPWVHRERSN